MEKGLGHGKLKMRPSNMIDQRVGYLGGLGEKNIGHTT